MRTSVGLALAIPFMTMTGCADVDKETSKDDQLISAGQELPLSTAAMAVAAVPSGVTDYTSYTYVAPSGGIGTFANYQVTRTFDRPIASLKLYIEAGRADDIGYVGSRLVTSIPANCDAGVGTVTSEQDVTDQVTINGNVASFVLRTKESCCCWTGWGSATQSDRADALFKWVVTFSNVPPPCGDGVCNGSETCASCATDCCEEPPCCPPGSTCLAGDTPVTMADGSSKAIADVVKGERVLSYQPETGVFMAADVTQTFRHPDAEGTVLVNGRLRATPNHPFFVDGVWKRADELAVGDVLTRLDGGTNGAMRMMVEPVRVETLESVAGRLTTYNLEVAGTHDYFAGGYLVHNKSCRICELQ